MTTRRIAKLSRAILEQVSSSILFDLKDPRVRNVTVTDVELSSDAQHARVFVSVMGDERDEARCLHGLNSARGFLQSKVAARVRTRNTPILSFSIDRGVKRSIEVSRLLREEAAARERRVPHTAETEASAAAEESASAQREAGRTGGPAIDG